MANIARIRLPGFWTQNSVVDPDEFEDLDEIRPWLPNLSTGSSHTPSGFVTVGGSGFQLTGTGHEVATSARLTVQSTGEIRVASGGLIRLDGTSADIDLKVTAGTPLIDVGNGCAVRILSGGSLDVFGTTTFKNTSGPGTAVWENNTSATFQLGSTLTVQSGSTATIADGGTLSVAGQLTITTDGNITLSGAATVLGGAGSTVTLQGTNNLSSLALVGASTWPTLATARDVTRPAVRAIALSFADGAGSVGPDDPDMWECKSGLSAAPAFRTRNATASGRTSILEVLDLPVGSVITGAEIDSRGTEAANVSSTLPTYQIVSWSSGEGGLASHSTATNDGGAALTFGATTTTTTVGNSGDAASRTITAGRRYGILVTHPFQSSVGQGVWVYKCNILASAESIRV